MNPIQRWNMYRRNTYIALTIAFVAAMACGAWSCHKETDKEKADRLVAAGCRG